MAARGCSCATRQARRAAQAQAAGYRIGLGLGSRVAVAEDPPLQLPRIIAGGEPDWVAQRLVPRVTAGGG